MPSASSTRSKKQRWRPSEYSDHESAWQQFKRFIEGGYQTKRIRLALGYLTPQEFAAKWTAGAG